MKLVSPFVATIILVIITISIGIAVYMYLSSVTKTTTTTEEVINCLGGDFKIINFNREKRIIDGLVGAWKFDEGSGNIAYDSSGNNNHGTIYGATWIDEKFGKALQFDGVDDYVKIEPFTVYGWKGISIVRWVKLPSYKPNTYWSKSFMIGDFWTDRPSFLHAYPDSTTVSSVGMQFRTRKPDGSLGLYGWSVTVLDRWVFIVDTFDLATRARKGYLNAELNYSVTIPSNEKTILEWDLNTATNPSLYKRFTIGSNVFFGEYVNEVVDEVLIFNRALSEEEIKDLYSYYQNSEISNGKITILTNRYSFNLYFIGNPQSSLGSKYIAYITLKNDTVIKKDIDISPCNLGSECISSPTINIETDSEIKKIEICSKACSYVCSRYIVGY